MSTQELWPDALFFDVDGVLIDSVHIKGDAFVSVFRDIPGSETIVRQFHLTHGGLTRSNKIRQLLVLLSDDDVVLSDIQHRTNKYARIVESAVAAAPESPGAEHALQMWSRRCPIHAVSATPTNELRHILRARGLSGYFKSIEGWPPPKASILDGLITRYGYMRHRCILIGDSAEDRAASLEANVGFILKRNATTPLEDSDDPFIQDLSELDLAIPQLLERRMD